MTLTATPESEYLFIGWTENGEQVSTDENITFMVDRNRTLVANFELIPKIAYTVQVSSTKGGAVDGGGSYNEGESVTVNAVPNNGYRFQRWEENGVQVSTEARFSFTAEADRTLVAVFDLIPQSTTNWTPTISYVQKGVNVKPVPTSISVKEEVKKPTLTNGKAVLTAPDDLFWGGYKTGRANGAGTVTRADLAQLIYSMMDAESKKVYGVTHPPFRDVESSAWYETAVGAMLDTGVMFGCGNNQFCPDRTLTWGELLTVFSRFTEDKPLTEYYKGEHWAKDSVNKAFTLGWLKYAEGFDPERTVTTGEMVNLIQAVFQWNSK
ncbi:MAG: S-layer homology domain-containing protein [Oscillospiraceae bacterium]|nr:S-layer homology domain-containing protein [Oscillospiraceae bacterium]